jgi:hypothetical protein
MMLQNIFINNCTFGNLKSASENNSYYVLLQDAVIEYDDCQIAVLINWVENKKQMYYGILVVKFIEFKLFIV